MYRPLPLCRDLPEANREEHFSPAMLSSTGRITGLQLWDCSPCTLQSRGLKGAAAIGQLDLCSPAALSCQCQEDVACPISHIREVSNSHVCCLAFSLNTGTTRFSSTLGFPEYSNIPKSIGPDASSAKSVMMLRCKLSQPVDLKMLKLNHYR